MIRVKKTERIYEPADSMRDLHAHLVGHGDRTLFKYYSAPKEISEMTYGEFGALVQSIAAGFHKLGLNQGKIAIIGETSPNWVASYMAAILCGGIAVPMDKELLMEDTEALLASAEVDAIVFSRSFNKKLENAVANHPSLRYFIPQDPTDLPYADSEKVVTLDHVIAMGKADEGYIAPDKRADDAIAELLFTSGTTGSSKCVMLSEKNVIAAVNAACETVEFSKDDTIVSVLPVHHTYELCCMLAGMNYGMTIGINDSIKHALHNFKLFAPTGLVLVPLFVNTIYKRIMEEAKKTGQYKKLRFGLKLSRFLRAIGIDARRKIFRSVIEPFGGRLQKIVCGAAPLNPEMVEVFGEFGVCIMEGYGITECSPLISVNPYYALRQSSVGPAVPCCQVKIVDEDGKEVPTGENGEILAKGDNVMLGYYNNPEANQAAFTEDGWFRTGDIGHMDKDGYIYITGRKKSVIVLNNGKNVFPEEVEERIGEIEGVLESVVLGRKASDSDEVVVTAIVVPDFKVLSPDLSDEELLDIIKGRIMEMNKKLASFKQVRNVEIRREEFVKTTSRKIRRHLVK